MENFTNLLTDAFSETTVPSFSYEDLDFDHLDCVPKNQEEERDSITKTEKKSLHEATSETTSVLTEDVVDLLSMDGNVVEGNCGDSIDQKNPKEIDASPINIIKTPDYYTSLMSKDFPTEGVEENFEENGEKFKGLIFSGGTSVKFSCEEDHVGEEEQPLTLKGSADPQISNKEQDDAENNEQLSYFGKVNEQGSDVMIKTAASEDKQEEDKEDSSSYSKREIIQLEETFLSGNLMEKNKNTDRGDPPEASSAFPCISTQNLQDLIAEIDNKETIKELKEFSGDEHQEAGESVADYPSDLSFCVLMEDKRQYKINNQFKSSLFTVDACLNAQHETSQESAGMEDVWIGRDRKLIENEDPNSRDRNISGFSETRIKKVQSEKILENKGQLNPETEKQDVELSTESSTESFNSDQFFMINSGNNLPLYTMWDCDVVRTCNPLKDLETEDTNETETLQFPRVEISSYSLGEREDYEVTPSTSQRFTEKKSILDHKSKSSVVTEMVNDEYKEETSWEHEKERIKAFYKFYEDDDDDDDDVDEENERQIKVQFCADLLSRVIHYESESSESDSFISSTDREEDLSAADTSDVGNASITGDEIAHKHQLTNTGFDSKIFAQDQKGHDNLHVMPECDPLMTQKAETNPDHSHTQKHTCVRMLKLMLKTALSALVGLLIFWLFSEFPDCLSHVIDY